MDVEEGHRGDSGAAENVMPRRMFPEIRIRQTERSKNGKGFKGPGGENIKNYGQQIMSVKTPEGFARKSTWQVADVRRPLVSASHRRKKKEKSMLRKEGNVYVLDLFVRGAIQRGSAHRVHAHGG